MKTRVAILAVLLLVLAASARADDGQAPSACVPDETTLCLNNGRFQAQAIFSAPSVGLLNAPAQAVALTSDTGYFWFFSENNVEIALKVVDGRAFNGFFWAFYAALSDVAYTITVTDTITGAVKVYSNPQGTLASVADVRAFGGSAGTFTQSGDGSGGPYDGGWSGTTSPGRAIMSSIVNNVLTAIPEPEKRSFSSLAVERGVRIETSAITSPGLAPLESGGGCVVNAFAPCLNNGRFQVQVIFSAPSLGIQNKAAQAVMLTGDTAYFWFFTNNNVEIVLKVVDGRAFNGHFWVFYGAMSDVPYTIIVTDTLTNAVKTYTNPAGNLASVADVTAFPGGSGCAFTVASPIPSSFGSGGGAGTVAVTTSGACSFTASSNSGGLTITSGLSYTGSSTVTFQVGANSSTNPRTLSMTVAGQTVTVTQAGQSTGGIYDGLWTGTTSQGKAVSWTVAGNAFTQFRIAYAGPACGVADGAITVTYAPPRSISGTTFTHSGSGSTSPVTINFSVNGTFHSAFVASGTGTVTLSTSAPLPSCTTTVPITFTAVRN